MNQPHSLRELRHAARGSMNAVKLCTYALELDCTDQEQIEFLTDIIISAEKLGELMQGLAAVQGSKGSVPISG